MEAKMKTGTEFRVIALNSIDCDAYQRDIQYARCRKMAYNFDPRLVGSLLVSVRDDGKTVILDGHHRLIAMMMCGIKSAMCQVLRGLTYEQEAEIFRKYNTQRRSVNGKDILRAKMEEKNPVTLDMLRLARKAGYVCGKSQSNTSAVCIGAVKALEAAYEKLKPDMFYTMLDTLSSTWVGDRQAVSASMLNGATTFFSLYGDRIKRDAFVKALGGTTPTSILTKARLSGEQNLRYPVAEEMWRSYNKQCRGKNTLPYLF